MASLSSLIVQRELATMRQVEEALARQVIYGGDLATNLLEVARVDEALLTKLIAESMGLAPAPSGELPSPPDRVRALVPFEIATQRSALPLTIEGSKLVLVVAEPLPPDVQEQLAFALGMAIESRAAPIVRVREAIARVYGAPLERRMQRLVMRLAGMPSSSGSMPPPLGSVPAVPEPPRPPSAPPVRGTPAFGIPAVTPGLAGTPSMQPRRSTAIGIGVTHPPEAFKPMGSIPAITAPPDSRPPSTPMVAERRGGLLQREVAPGARTSRRRRGPLTLDAAKHEAGEAEDRDALLDLFFDFSRQYFDYTVLLLVHGDIAEGRDAFGVGASRERVLGIGVPLDMPSLLANAREKRVPLVAKPGADGLDAVLLADLHRARDAEMAVIPLVVRTRAVALLLGDCGDGGVDRNSVQQIGSFAAVVGKSFERIIVRRKLEGFIAGAPATGVGKVDAALVSGKRPSAAPSPSLGSAPAAGPVDASAAAAPESGRALSAQPPPPANLTVVRRIGGPPIPREDPGAPLEDITTGEISIVEPDLPAHREPVASTPQLEVSTVTDGDMLEELWEGDESPEGPPPSSAVAVPPHLPPSSRSLPPDQLPTVIVDLDGEISALVDRALTGEGDEAAEGELLRQGERAMRIVMARFPGPVAVDRTKLATSVNPPRPSECGPLLRLVARERKVALPFVLSRLEHPDPEVRGWATYLLSELPYAEAIAPLLLRLRDEDAPIRAAAAHSLAGVARMYPDEVRDAVVALAGVVDLEDRAAAMRVMGELRDPALVPELVRALADGNQRVVEQAHQALVQVSRQDFGTDARPWLRWWEQNAPRHRVEWLTDALTHEVMEIRRAAGEELRVISKEYFGYASDLPPRDRERAQQRYRDWWITEGRARFRRS
jgi:hypothetical protein